MVVEIFQIRADLERFKNIEQIHSVFPAVGSWYSKMIVSKAFNCPFAVDATNRGKFSFGIQNLTYT